MVDAPAFPPEGGKGIEGMRGRSDRCCKPVQGTTSQKLFHASGSLQAVKTRRERGKGIAPSLSSGRVSSNEVR
jgi:hypothetical protein